MISVGGVAVIGGTSGLPAGGTADDVLRGDGTWESAGDVVGGALEAIPAADLAGLIDSGRVTTPSLVSEAAGGWTPVDVTSPGTVTVTGGEVLVSIPNASTTSGAGGKESRAWPASGRNFEVIARVQMTGDADAEIQAVLRLDYIAAGAGFYWVLNAAGTWQAYSTFDNIESVALLTSGLAVTGMPRDGTGWTRVRISGQRLTLWTGIGVGSAAPVDSAWTLRYDADRSTLVGRTAPTALVLGGRSSGTHSVAGATTVRWSQVSVRNLGSGG